ncbi:PREDICTED: uncharacterized protein LOC104785650 [Camelina sativa]|uniref:Uncharacterized protein LOC104785650 n=1 Tax=Camelina sativa TaxID=90675 RepID=A0ABM0Z1R6_CAMSA|nr:PREDICTED: uncharacterized protein LOC104785650 [Camelina sativa]
MDSVRMEMQHQRYRLRNLEEETLSYGEFKTYCFCLAIALWFYAPALLMESIVGSENVWLGPNSSLLVKPSSRFVQSIEVKELDYSKPGLMLYGFYENPSLSSVVNWSESRVFPLSHDMYKGWRYFFNKGTLFNITYKVEPQGSEVQLVVEEGTRLMPHSSLDKIPLHDTARSRNLIQGSGMITLEISTSSYYYVTVANLKRKDVEVELTIDVRAVVFDTKQSSYNCTFGNGECIFKLSAMSLVGSSIVVTSPGLSQGVSIEDEWNISISYEHRWVAYIIATGLVFCFILVATQCCGGEGDPTDDDSPRKPLLADKDGNAPFTNDDASLDGNDEEAGKESRCVCTICYDAPRDCFFLPCGHCVSCFRCGTKIKKAAGRCPICRRRMMKVKRNHKA